MGAAASTDTLPDNLTEAEVRAFVGEENYQQDLFAANSVDNKMAKDKLLICFECRQFVFYTSMTFTILRQVQEIQLVEFLVS